MLDPKLLRNDLEEVKQQLAKRGDAIDFAGYQQLETKRKSLQTATENLQAKRNKLSKEVGIAKSQGQDSSKLLAEMTELSQSLKNQQRELSELQTQLTDFLQRLPNVPHSSVPLGNSEQDNVVKKHWSEPRQFTFKPKHHYELVEDMDFTASAKLSGARFVVLRDKVARLHRALIQFMLDLHSKSGYTELYVPYLVKPEILYGTGQFPKFIDDQFQAGNDLWLIPTAEVPVINLVRDTILNTEDLPLKYMCHSTCFRKEAGSYGKDTHGMLRQHQFDKVELAQIVKASDSYAVLEDLTAQAEKVLQLLQLPYRVVTLCTADLGFAASKTYDLEVWLPGEGAYREISSCSNTEAFQARRMQARWRNPRTNKPELVHTLNGSGLAIGRTLIAVIENYQQQDGSIEIPEVLWSYMGGVKVI